MPSNTIKEKKYISKILTQSFLAAFSTAAFTELTQVSSLLIDGILTSKLLGADEIAAVGLTNPLFFIIGLIATSFAAGLKVVCAREMGRGRIERVNEFLNETLIVAGAISAILCVLILALASPAAFVFGARGAAAGLHVHTVNYIRGLSFESVPFILMMVLIPVVSLDNGGRTVMISAIVGAVTNVLFDWVAIRTGTGIFGVGVATSLSVLLSFLCVVTHFFRKNRLLQIRAAAVRWADIREILHLGGATAAHGGMGVIRPLLLNSLIVAVGGSMAMSVMSIRSGVSNFVDVPAVGIAGAVALLTGVGCGELNGEDIEGVDILSRRLLTLTSLVLAAVLVVLAPAIAVFYLGPDSPGLPLLTFAIRTLAVDAFFSGMVRIRVSYLEAVESIREAQLIEMASNLVVLLLCAFVLSRPFGIYGIYAAFPVSKILVLAGVLVECARKAGRLIPSQREFLKLDERFYPDVSDIIEYPVRDRMECVLAGRQLRYFCIGHQMDKKRSYYAALCAEEISTNIIEHGFEHKNRLSAAEIRVTVSGDDLILRVRDNGVEFNLNSIARIVMDDQDPYANMGIKMIVSSAKKIDYYRSWGMNVTILRI